MRSRPHSIRKRARTPAAISTIIMTMTTAIITMAEAGTTPPSPSITPTPAHGLLRLLAWLSPTFPTGAFAYSHGIEWAVEAGDITDGDTLHDWLADLLSHGAPRSDAILLRHAHKRDASLDPLAELAAATAATRERHAESLNQGAAFMRAARPWGCPTLPDPVAYAIAVGALAGRH